MITHHIKKFLILLLQRERLNAYTDVSKKKMVSNLKKAIKI